MGDAGSLFLGFMLAAVGIKLRFPHQPDSITWMIPILVLGLPIFDMTLVTVSRLRRGVNPWTTAGKDHTSHRLARLGLKSRGSVLVLYGLCIALGAVGLAIQFVPSEVAYGTFGLTVVLGALALAWLERERPLATSERVETNSEQH
jgi:UDP-GlcNAc:undecaprenyl-phosphate GlcNAc-1-phosphate transferase